jgi:hypothetical protein
MHGVYLIASTKFYVFSASSRLSATSCRRNTSVNLAEGCLRAPKMAVTQGMGILGCFG